MKAKQMSVSQFMKTMLSKKSLIVVAIAAIVFGGLALAFNQATAQRQEEIQDKEKSREQNPLRALSAIDSRLVNVPRPCTADQVTIIPDSVPGEGASCEEAKADCRAKLAKSAKNKADKECKLYEKMDDESVQCRAYRGNFDPTTNIQYDPCTQRPRQEFFDVRCTNQTPIKYTCN